MLSRLGLALLAVLALGCQKGQEAKIVDRLDEINARLITLEGRMARIETLAETVSAPGVPIHLPSAAEPLDARTVSVALSAGALTVNGKEVDADDLEATFSEISDATPGASVILTADAGVPHARVVATMDAIKRAGLTKIAIAVQKTEPAAP